MLNEFPHHRETSHWRITFGSAIEVVQWRRVETKSVGGVVGTLFAAVAVVAALPVVFDRMLTRSGAMPYEPFLHYLPPKDLSTLIFGVLYAAIFLAILLSLKDPIRLFRSVQAYIMLIALRIFCMLLVPLEPPIDLVTLQDPFAQLFYPSVIPFEKDLFFSGHTAAAFLLFLPFPVGSGGSCFWPSLFS
ncbi:MAG: hypothetical protein IPI00_19210 [Flavobacteriales bacterium]|nr:hypothetical protein [Flavobacteriales bacterium]